LLVWRYTPAIGNYYTPKRCLLIVSSFERKSSEVVFVGEKSMTVTLGYAGALGLWFLVLSVRVIQGRVGPGNPSLGDDGNPAMLRRIRGHGNFAEYVPLILGMIGFLELSGEPKWAIHALGASLLIGRILHGYAFSFTDNNPIGRTGGVVLTLVSLLATSCLCLYRAFLG
jgi:uncharacterized membrane protein YecN with MAPEG domain